MIGLASDHAGYDLKQYVKTYLEEKGIEYIDYGTYSTDSCDYPDYAHALARGIEQNEVEKGIAICGSGEGISMTLNKHQRIRAALVWIPEIAHMTRLHNDANVLAIGAGVIGENVAMDVVDTFLSTAFSGEERHARRIAKIAEYEKKQ